VSADTPGGDVSAVYVTSHFVEGTIALGGDALSASSSGSVSVYVAPSATAEPSAGLTATRTTLVEDPSPAVAVNSPVAGATGATPHTPAVVTGSLNSTSMAPGPSKAAASTRGATPSAAVTEPAAMAWPAASARAAPVYDTTGLAAVPASSGLSAPASVSVSDSGPESEDSDSSTGRPSTLQSSTDVAPNTGSLNSTVTVFRLAVRAVNVGASPAAAVAAHVPAGSAVPPTVTAPAGSEYSTLGVEAADSSAAPSASVTSRAAPRAAAAPAGAPRACTVRTSLAASGSPLSVTARSAAATVPAAPSRNVSAIDVVLPVSAVKSGTCVARAGPSHALPAVSATPVGVTVCSPAAASAGSAIVTDAEPASYAAAVPAIGDVSPGPLTSKLAAPRAGPSPRASLNSTRMVRVPVNCAAADGGPVSRTILVSAVLSYL